MECALARLPAVTERPAVLKFAHPLVLLPELFTTISHLSLLTGYLVSLGWEVSVLDLYAETADEPRRVEDLVERTAAAIGALDRRVIALGHGLGGLVALGLTTRPAVAAAVALAPALPGSGLPFCRGLRNRLAVRFGGMLRPPRGRALFELVSDADEFQRETLMRTLRPVSGRMVRDFAAGAFTIGPADGKPRLIVTGDADSFAPLEQVRSLATATGAELAALAGRGHWLVGGRALERAVHETQRFLVKAVGRELLLLYPDEPAAG
jgi:pimeloyl-ACP methyl ester carboxylesterase